MPMSLSEMLISVLQNHSELAVFLVVGLGALIGSYKFKNVSLGIVTGSLFVGLLVGQMDIPVSAPAKQVMFSLFLIATGYAIGPQFLRALKGDGVKFMTLAVVQCLFALGTVVVVAKLLNLDLGLAAGLMSGGLTQSAVIGSAGAAIMALPLEEAQRELLVSHIAIADSLTYVFGTLGTIWFLSLLAPRLLGINLKQASLELEKSFGMDEAHDESTLPGFQAFTSRAVRITDAAVAGKQVQVLENFANPETRVYIGRIRRGKRIITALPKTILRLGDVISLSGRNERVLAAQARLGEETTDVELLDVPVTRELIMVSKSEVIGRSLRELAMGGGSRGLFVRSITRLGQDMPVMPDTTLQRGDVIELMGKEDALAVASEKIGQVYHKGAATDMRAVCLALFVGGLIGVPTFLVGSVGMGLGTSVGILLGGIFLGWLHSVRPTFGYLPEAASSFMSSFGLAAFVGMTGMQAGPHFMAALHEYGISLLLGGVVVTLVPLLFGLFFGRYALGINPVLLIGACAGARVSTPALAAVQEQSESGIAVLGYTAPYAIGQILLTLWGGVLIGILA